MGVRLTFEITFSSDFHIGAGYGDGAAADSSLYRDGDGTAAVPGTVLAGLLRDAFYRLLNETALKSVFEPKCKASGSFLSDAPAYCGAGGTEPEGGEPCPVCRILGSPASPKRWRIGSARPADAPVPVDGYSRPPLDSRSVFRCRVDPEFRRVEAGKLYSAEEGSGDLSFVFRASCDDDGNHVEDEAALLTAAARFVREMGRSRRRGGGECLLRLIEAEGLSLKPGENETIQDKLLERFRDSWLSAKLSDPVSDEESPRLQAKPKLVSRKVPEGKERLVFLAILRLDEPLLIAERAVAGNQFQGGEMVPGTTIRGALGWKAIANMRDRYDDFLSLFLRGATRFHPFYPAVKQGRWLFPTIPAPMDMAVCKTEPRRERTAGCGFFPLALEDQPLLHCPECAKSGYESHLEPAGGFVPVGSACSRFTVVPSKRSELHIRIHPKTGAVNEGDLYGYTLLEAGQYMAGALEFSDENAWKAFQDATGMEEKVPFPLRLGKANRRGRGKCLLWVERVVANPLCPFPLEKRVADPGKPVSLLFLTDAVIRDPWGRFAEGIEAPWLERELGLGPVKILGDDRAFCSSGFVNGFNAAPGAGLPRWRDRAIRAGSVAGIVLENPPDDVLARMVRLESEGIGLRKSEGFGRIAFNHAVYGCGPDDRKAGRFELDPAMDKPDAPRDENPFVSSRGFESQWMFEMLDKLNANRSALRDPRFEGLARWLNASAKLSPDEILSEMESFGVPSPRLKETLGGSKEYGDRDKDNFFKTDGKKGVQALRDLLERLKRFPEKHHPRGVQLSAAQLSQMIRKE